MGTKIINGNLNVDGDLIVKGKNLPDTIEGKVPIMTTDYSNGAAYIQTSDGKTTLKAMGINAGIGQSIVLRTSNANIVVPLTPAANDCATSKQYVDNTITGISAGTTLYEHRLSLSESLSGGTYADLQVISPRSTAYTDFGQLFDLINGSYYGSSYRSTVIAWGSNNSLYVITPSGTLETVSTSGITIVSDTVTEL